MLYQLSSQAALQQNSPFAISSIGTFTSHSSFSKAASSSLHHSFAEDHAVSSNQPTSSTEDCIILATAGTKTASKAFRIWNSRTSREYTSEHHKHNSTSPKPPQHQPNEATFRTQHQTKFSIEKTREPGTCCGTEQKQQQQTTKPKVPWAAPSSTSKGQKVKGGNQAQHPLPGWI
ncbi:hypothetical protein Nepgr_026035 [Nepenthes gracilis]|uniref:Uncharacterized protein n=1 Tax=Nepenthes gracilis TaxID=150966 RepID=A0AAD3Y014_NEPGR|nr:hypothetical protein Nepgr_026035 [Nepenthes gracilis]